MRIVFQMLRKYCCFVYCFSKNPFFKIFNNGVPLSTNYGPLNKTDYPRVPFHFDEEYYCIDLNSLSLMLSFLVFFCHWRYNALKSWKIFHEDKWFTDIRKPAKHWRRRLEKINRPKRENPKDKR